VKTQFIILTLLLQLNASAQQQDTFHIYFALNDTSLNDEALEQVSALSLNKSATETDTLLLMGYADMLGKDPHNEWLSTMRAQRVRERLIAQGISKTAFKLCIGKGAIKRDTVPGKEGIQEDRRVDIIAPRGIIIKKRVPTYVKKGKPFNPDSFSHAKRGDLFLLAKVQFVVNRHTYVKGSEEELDELYKILAQNPQMHVRIEGHVCCVPFGTDAEDWDVGKDLTKDELRIEENRLDRRLLSHNRAWKVRDYLIKKGINHDRITYTGYGSTRPAFKEDSPENRTKNMRVEVRITQD
jgi:outer membrane protein OmpA-like peptidoglycan-associated protein